MKVIQSCPTLWPHGLCSPWNSPGQNTGVGSCFLLQGIFQTQGLNSGLPHCRWILYQLSHQGSPRILEWVAYPFSIGSSRPRNWTRVSCIAGRFFTCWAPGEAQWCWKISLCALVPNLLQEGGPLPGPESGLLSNTPQWIVGGNTRADFIGKGTWMESSRVREPRRTALPRDLLSQVLW